ncbi:MAG: alpha-galactosidase [Micrococcales bacterium]|nr:alpha-galactosidase [Micrococcales bacterium]
MNIPFLPIDEIAVRAAARVYEHGWQSFSPSHVYRLDERPRRPVSERNRILNYRQDSAPSADAFFGEGLLAVEDGFGVTHVVASEAPFTTAVRIRAEVRPGSVTVSADGPVLVTTSEQPLEGALRSWAERAAAGAGVSAPHPAPTAWCSWYTYYGGVGPDDIAENLAAMDAFDLPVDVVQLDDGYSAGIGDWLTPSARFADVAGLVGRIKDTGRRAGIWIAPFLAAADSALATEHPDWLVQYPHGAPRHAGHNWNRDLLALDLTHPDAAEWIQTVVETFVSWGIDYLKADFLAAGAIPGTRYSGADPITAYRDGLALVRGALGSSGHLLGCGAPMLPSVGLVDSMRVSADTDAKTEPDNGDYSSPSQAAARFGAEGRQFMNGVFFVNDPDCLIVGEQVANREQWAAHVEATHGAVVSSDRLARLDGWGLATTRRLLTSAAGGWH